MALNRESEATIVSKVLLESGAKEAAAFAERHLRVTLIVIRYLRSKEGREFADRKFYLESAFSFRYLAYKMRQLAEMTIPP